MAWGEPVLSVTGRIGRKNTRAWKSATCDSIAHGSIRLSADALDRRKATLQSGPCVFCDAKDGTLGRWVVIHQFVMRVKVRDQMHVHIDPSPALP